MTLAVVEAVAVSRRYVQGGQPFDALLPATFTIAQGDRIALTGPSGSGKTTLLQLLGRLDTPSAGALSWPALVDDAPLHRSRIGMVFQSPSLLPSLSVVENVELPLRLGHATDHATNHGPDDVRNRAMAALEAVGLAALADALPDELSGGQAQRVGIARALAPRPALLLADEPTGQLDQATARAVFDVLLATLDRTTMTLVVATHDPAIAARLDRVWAMSHGRLTVPPVSPRPEGISA